MRRPLLALLCCLAFAAAPAVELPALPAGTVWLVHLDLRQALASPFGDLVRQAIGASIAKPDVQGWIALAGIDPEKDIDRLVASGVDFSSASGTMVVSGRFDAARLTALVETARGHQTIPHGGTTIHRWLDQVGGNREVFAALLDGDLVFASSLASAERSLDALAAGAAAPADGPVATAAHFAGPMIAVVAADGLERLPRLDQDAAMLRQVRKLAASLRVEGEQVVGTVVAGVADEATASQLLQIGQGLLALAALNKDTPPEIKAVLATVQLGRSGSELTLRVGAPIATVRTALVRPGAGR